MALQSNQPNLKDYDYDRAWKEVEKSINDGLPKSALTKVEEILKVATNEKNDPQFAKSIIYIARLSVQTDEKGIEKSIDRLEVTIKTTDRPVKYIAASYLAELYQRYFDNYRWEISQRSDIAGDKATDFRTWTTQQFLVTIEKWYLYSIENKIAINIPVDQFKAVLNKYDREAVKFRPTLYEVLADRAFAFFNSYDNYVSENSESFQIDQEWYFADNEVFSKKSIETNDKSSRMYKVLSLSQDILKTQIQNYNKSALADYDLSRLEYVFRNSTLENKIALYKKSLENLAEAIKDDEMYPDVISVLANFLILEKEFDVKNTDLLKLCENAIKKFPASKGAAKCQNIIAEIKSPFLQLYGENVYPSKKPILYAIEHKNIKNVRIETVKLGSDFDEKFNNRDQQEIKEFLLKAKKLSGVNHTFKLNPEFIREKTELYIEPQKYGTYALLVYDNLDKGNQSFQYIIFQVSDLAYTTYRVDNKRVLIVSDRTDGVPMKGVKVSILSQNYNPGNRRFEFVKSNEYISNKVGRVNINEQIDQNIKFVLSHKADILDLNQYHYNYMRQDNSENKFAEFFTDRSIYRPGQIIYFKAILLKNDKNQVPNIIPNTAVEVIFRDANYQEISKQRLTSNEFGSLNGSFVIPAGRLNGMYTIAIQTSDGIHGQKAVNVEEYKRPTFEVTIDPLQGEYNLTDKIKVTGKAQTLAGSNVDGGLVKYKVVRSVRYPSWGWWWRLPYPSEDFNVSQGETQSKDDGSFIFEFEAIPDRKVDKKTNPVFSYRIDVDVTDQRGETRTTQSTVSAGYTAFSLSINTGKNIDIDELKPYKVKAINHNDQNINVKGTIKVSLLQAPKSVKVNKYWEGKVDFPLPRTVADKLFPQFPSSPETDFSIWPIAKQVLSSGFNTQDFIDLSKVLSPGVYKIELESQDKNQQKVTSEQYIVVANFAKGIFPTSDYVFYKLNQTTAEPGQKILIHLGASEKPVFVHYIIEKDGRLIAENTLKVDKKSEITLPITEAYRGGVNVKLVYMMSNRTFTQSYFINVPWTNKQLYITYETFRDKTLPGSKEEYRIKISGKNKDKVAAELVAGMYDASLDQFISHTWRTTYYPQSYAAVHMEVPGFHLVNGRYYSNNPSGSAQITDWNYPELMPLMDAYGGRGDILMSKAMRTSGVPENADMMMDQATESAPAPASQANDDKSVNPDQKSNPNKKPDETILLRQNLKETVFFFPELKTDIDGNIILSFTMNEALTKWRLMTFAHTKDFQYGYDERFVRTQKNLMIFPNAPRFMRDGDKISFAAKVTNMTEGALSGQATLRLLDAITMKDITSELVKTPQDQKFTLTKGLSAGLSWDLDIPENKYQAITYRIIAEADGHSDGEENTLPVISNNVLVTESMPVWVKGKETRTFTFNGFKNNNSATKKDFRYTFEYTSNPVWYAIQALPYLSNSNHSGTQALIDRYYANALSSGIANAHPKIKSVMNLWQMKDKDALISNLSKNQELKNAVLEETPWVNQAMSESEQKRNIAILFDINKMAEERLNTIKKLSERQLTNGGFPWFPGGRDDIYTTQNVMENLGHLRFLGVLDSKNPEMDKMISSALLYMDVMLAERYTKLKAEMARTKGNIDDDHLDELSVHYLYVKTFFPHVKVSSGTSEARDYYFGQAKKYWTKRSLYIQAMIGLILHRNDDNSVLSIIKSLREKSFKNDELGMYWNEGNGFYWYQLPVERHALLIELFTEASTDANEVDQMKIWLLKNKQTNHWKTSKSTASAIYALLVKGEDAGISAWITENNTPQISIGKDNLKAEISSIEEGTGYIKKTYTPESITKDLETIKINNTNKSIAWGAAYYQYFEQADKIKSFSDTPLKLNKKLYKVIKTSKGDKIEEITSTTSLEPGERIKVRIELRVDRAMEYVHMKDMRASGFEPENIISQYKYQGQLGYYETTKDVASHFYFNYLPIGTFVFEYPVICVHKGDFSAGITTIESMYAPEFKSHSEGVRIKVR
jgi:hypothetical protein